MSKPAVPYAAKPRQFDRALYRGRLFVVRHEEWFEIGRGSTLVTADGPVARPWRRRSWTREAVQEVVDFMGGWKGGELRISGHTERGLPPLDELMRELSNRTLDERR